MSNPTILELWQNPYHMQPHPAADTIGQEGTPGEGAYMTVYLSLQENEVQSAYFETYGCPSAIACGSWLCRWVEGKTIDAARDLEANDLSVILALPLGKEHCASLTVKALRSALRQIHSTV